MATRGVDFSYDKPGATALKAAGFSFVVGYVSPSSGKNLTKAQIHNYHSAHLNVGIVYEDHGTEPLHPGLAPGIVRLGNSQMDALGAPLTTTMYCAMDRQVAGSATAAFFREAARLSKRPIGVYGSFAVVKYLMSNRILKYGWQTYAWSGGNLYGAAQVYQYSNNHHVAGGTVDYNYQEHSDAGFWLWSPTPVVHPPVTVPVGTHKYPLLPRSGILKYSSHPRFSAYAKSVQRKLSVNGYHPGVADGLYGAHSVSAVRAFQHAHGLAADGVVGPKTDAALRREPR